MTDSGEFIADLLDYAVGEAFKIASKTRERPPHHWSLSGLGGCTRKSAYQVAGIEPSDTPPPREGRAANLGTWQHEGLLPYLAMVLRRTSTGARSTVKIEEPVILRAYGIDIPGTADLWWPSRGVVFDLKTVREFRLKRVDVKGPDLSHRVQVWGYAVALEQRKPGSVQWVSWLYLDRASGEHRVRVEKFTAAGGAKVIDRVRRVLSYAREHGPDTAPREENGPGLSYVCDECPWLRRCWGPEAKPGVEGAQAIVAHDDPTTEALLLGYVRDVQAASDINARKDFAKAALSHKPEGAYGRVVYRRTRGYDKVDAKAAAALLTDHFLPVPVVRVAGKLDITTTGPIDGSRETTQ